MNPLFSSLSVLKIKGIYRLELFKFIHKYENNSLPDYFNIFLLNPMLICKTRSAAKGKLVPPLFSTTQLKNY